MTFWWKYPLQNLKKKGFCCLAVTTDWTEPRILLWQWWTWFINRGILGSESRKIIFHDSFTNCYDTMLGYMEECVFVCRQRVLSCFPIFPLCTDSHEAITVSLIPTLPTMQLGCWVTSMEAIHQITCGFFWSHKKALHFFFNICSSPPQDL